MRLLSNLETSTYKLIQIVFAAPPEFENILDHPRLRSLKQRIAVRAKILPLSAEESEEYIRHRLSVASISGEPVFTERAVKIIAAKAGGIPRVINILCDNALVMGLRYQQKPVDAKIVREVLANQQPLPAARGRARGPSWVPAAAGFLAVLLAVLFLLLYKAFDTLEQHKAPLQEAATNPFGPPAAVDKRSRSHASWGPRPPADHPKRVMQPPKKAVVRKDDTLFRLTVQAYGFSNDRVMEFVKQNNPSIKDVRKIEEGATIVFPPLDESLKESR
jgi:general secretion pathway protein A